MKRTIILMLSVFSFACVPYYSRDSVVIEKPSKALVPVKINALTFLDQQLTLSTSPKGDVCLAVPSTWRLFGFKGLTSQVFDLNFESPNMQLIGGNLKGFFILDAFNSNIHYYNWWGSKEAAWPYADNNSCGTFSIPGRIYLASKTLSKISVFDQFGKFLGQITPTLKDVRLTQVTAMAVSPDAAYMVVFDSDTDRLYLLSGYGQQLYVLDVKLSLSASSICFSRNGWLWACDRGENMVRIFLPSNSGLVPVDSLSIDSPVALAEAEWGNMYLVTDRYLWMIKYR